MINPIRNLCSRNDELKRYLHLEGIALHALGDAGVDAGSLPLDTPLSALGEFTGVQGHARWASEASGSAEPTIRDLAFVLEGANRVVGTADEIACYLEEWREAGVNGLRQDPRQRIEEAADRMAKELLGIATSAESEAVKLAAVLDRAGLKPPAQVELSAKPPEPWEELLGDVMAITKAQHEAWKRGEYQPATPAPLPDPPALAAPVDDDVLDAEVVEPPVSPPSADEDDADAPSVPEWVEPPPASRTGQLVPLEQATAEAAPANHAARVSQSKRKRS